MEKKYSIFLALLITSLIAINFLAIKTTLSPPREKAIISRIIDGDTLELEDKRIIRLLNINTPEKNRLHYELSIDFLRQLINKSVELEITETDKYDRLLARIYIPEYLNLELVKNGLASKFLVNEEELKEFSEAETQAIEEERGIWKRSRHFNCFETEINQLEEKITISNNCNKINMLNFILKDESRKQYEFKNIEIDTSKPITLRSGKGSDNETDIFWNIENVWNNDRDTLYLFDSEGKITHYYSYGY